MRLCCKNVGIRTQEADGCRRTALQRNRTGAHAMRITLSAIVRKPGARSAHDSSTHPFISGKDISQKPFTLYTFRLFSSVYH